MALSKVTYVDGVTIIGAKNLNDIQDELIRQGEQQTEDEESMEAALALKADKSTTYTKTEVDSALALKADKSDTYTKAQMDASLALKADKADTYTKAEVDASLELKADKTDTYTKAQVDSIVEDAIAEAVKESEYSNFEMKSVSGDFIHITDGAGLIPVKDLKIGIDAVQDLHGYDAPWVGGAGKNKINIPDGTTSESVRLGNATATLGAGTYTLSIEGYRADAGSCTFKVNKTGETLLETESVVGATTYTKITGTFTLQEETTIWVSAAFKASYSTLYYRNAMIESGSEATAYAPYSNICPISGWTGAKVSVNGVNQWDEEWELGGINSSTGANYSSDTVIRSKNYIRVLPNETYYVKSPATLVLLAYDENKNFIKRAWAGYNTTTAHNQSFTVPSNVHYIRFNLAATTYNHDISVNYPSTETDYHAYDGNTYSVTWEEAGTVYGGTLDVTTGELVVTWGKKVFDGSETWGVESNANFYSQTGRGASDSPIFGDDKMRCSHAPSVGAYPTVTYLNCFISQSGNLNIQIPSNVVPHTAEDIKTWVAAQYNSGTPLTVCFELLAPQTYQLTPTEVLTLLGENNIFADTGAVEELIYRISRQ